MAALKTYDPGFVIVTFNGVPLTGFSENSMVKVVRDEDAFSKKVGADGEVTRVRNRNRTGSVTVTLMQSSASNDALSAFAALDENGASGKGPLMIKDLLGTTLHLAQDAWIKKMPDDEKGKEMGEREWVFDCGELLMFEGGNL